MNRKKVIAGSIIVLLLLLNLRQWLFNDEEESAIANNSVVVAEFTAEDFHLNTAAGLQPTAVAATVKRDLFFGNAAENVDPDVSGRPAKPAKVAARPKAVDEKKLAQEAAQAGLNSFRLVGIVYNQGRYQAFIIRDDKTYTGDDGKLLEGRYLVESVDENTITLIDTETGLNKRIELSGDEVP